jgi:hypothetical protein
MERTAFTVLAFAAFAAMAFFLLRKSEAGYRGIAQFQGRSAFSTGSFFNPSLEPRKAVDGNPDTAWKESPPLPGRFCIPTTADPAGKPSPIEMPPCLFLQVDLGFTHAPAAPPLKQPPLQMTITSGGAANARPRKVNLVFFSQEIVDMDREFRLPPLPEYVAHKTMILPDQPIVAVDLSFLPPPLDSPRYPAGVRRLQVRIEILDVYPGRDHPNTVAISEVTYSHRAE